MFKKLILVLLLAGLMSACSSDDPSVVILPGGPSVDIVTVSGGVHTLKGAYFSFCYPQTTGSRMDFLSVNDDEWTNTADVYISADCGKATPEIPTVSTVTATMVKGVTTAITGWVDGTAVAPDAADGSSGPLDDNEAVTEIEMTVTEVTGTQFSPAKVGDKFTVFYVADDTDADSTGFGAVLYRDANSDASTINPFFK